MHIRETVREDLPAVADIHVKAWRKEARHLFSADTMASWTVEDRLRKWEKNFAGATSGGTKMYTAEQDGKVVGFGLGGTMRDAKLRIRYTGEVYALFIHPDYQERGAGTKLLEEIMGHLQEIGHKRAALWVPSSFSSASYFQKHAQGPLMEDETTIKGTTLKEEAYGWDKIIVQPKQEKTYM
ncbi:GNAT family N-acetyltransferase [Alkalicoccus urumqiensis]|nr:GNAT family N-acetyltransferase [Alkalicoccus urumqiensis]